METHEQRVLRIGELDLIFLVGHKDATVFECIISSGAHVPAPHYHRDVDETLYGLEGVLTVTMDGQRQQLGVGDAIFIPRGSVHYHENSHEGKSRFLVVLTPGTISRRYFEEIAKVINVPGKPDPARIKDVMLRHGLVPA